MKYPYISTKGCAKIGYFPPLWLANSFPEVCGVLGVCSCHRFRICYKTFTFCSLLTRCKIPCACCAKRHLNVQTRSAPVSFLHLWLRNVLRATKACTFSTSQLPKALRTHYFFLHFWLRNISKCASRHNGVHFFDISISKSGPSMVCFDVFWTFWLGNVLRATTACTFSTSQLPNVVLTWYVLCILTWKCASRHNGVQLLWSHGSTPAALGSLLTFRPSRATKNWKNIVFRGFPTFSRACIFFLLSLSLSLTLPTSAFPSVHIVGSLTSKLPSIKLWLVWCS